MYHAAPKFITRYFLMIPFNMSGILHCKLSVVWLMLVISGSNGALGAGYRIIYNNNFLNKCNTIATLTVI